MVASGLGTSVYCKPSGRDIQWDDRILKYDIRTRTWRKIEQNLHSPGRGSLMATGSNVFGVSYMVGSKQAQW